VLSSIAISPIGNENSLTFFYLHGFFVVVVDVVVVVKVVVEAVVDAAPVATRR